MSGYSRSSRILSLGIGAGGGERVENVLQELADGLGRDALLSGLDPKSGDGCGYWGGINHNSLRFYSAKVDRYDGPQMTLFGGIIVPLQPL